jgi:hypothetical protein
MAMAMFTIVDNTSTSATATDKTSITAIATDETSVPQSMQLQLIKPQSLQLLNAYMPRSVPAVLAAASGDVQKCTGPQVGLARRELFFEELFVG